MDYVKLGNTGLDVSPICLGAMSFGTAEGWVHNEWGLNEEESRTIVKRALDLGVNFFDTANAYAYGASEEILDPLAWLLQKAPVVATVIGATKVAHLESAVDSLSLRLTSDDIELLEEPYVPHPVVGLIPYGDQLLSARR